MLLPLAEFSNLFNSGVVGSVPFIAVPISPTGDDMPPPVFTFAPGYALPGNALSSGDAPIGSDIAPGVALTLPTTADGFGVTELFRFEYPSLTGVMFSAQFALGNIIGDSTTLWTRTVTCSGVVPNSALDADSEDRWGIQQSADIGGDGEAYWRWHWGFENQSSAGDSIYEEPDPGNGLNIIGDFSINLKRDIESTEGLHSIEFGLWSETGKDIRFLADGTTAREVLLIGLMSIMPLEIKAGV